MRGKAAINDAPWRDMGSPPPMRGKAATLSLIGSTTGITPAHAGKSWSSLSLFSSHGDHPRPCGEKSASSPVASYTPGSPPPMRGKVRLFGGGGSGAGITPAHAGKSSRRRIHHRRVQDHPRPCGEKNPPRGSNRAGVGSPPPMRGKVSAHVARLSSIGITPAHAGKRLRKRRNTGIFIFQISRFHSVSHTPDTSYGNRPALYVRRLPRTPAALQASKAYDRARWAAYAWLFAVCPHTGS